MMLWYMVLGVVDTVDAHQALGGALVRGEVLDERLEECKQVVRARRRVEATVQDHGVMDDGIVTGKVGVEERAHRVAQIGGRRRCVSGMAQHAERHSGDEG